MTVATANPTRIDVDSLVRVDRTLMVRRYVAVLARFPGAGDVDDLAQEVFMRAIERIDRIASPDRIDPFLRGIARRVVQEHFRARRRSSRHVELTADAMIVDRAAPLEAAHDRQMQRLLSIEIERLPVVSRRMLEMRYHDGCSAVDIGAALGIDPGAVRVTLLRIRRRLRQRVATRAAATPIA